jgi:hypothetical protein
LNGERLDNNGWSHQFIPMTNAVVIAENQQVPRNFAAAMMMPATGLFGQISQTFTTPPGWRGFSYRAGIRLEGNANDRPYDR